MDFSARRTALAARVERRNLAAYCIVPGPNLAYLTGLHAEASERLFLCVQQPGAPLGVICPQFEVGRVRDALPDARIVGYRDETGWAPAVARALNPFGTRAVPLGAEFQTMRLFERAAIEEALPRARFNDIDGDLSVLRKVKDPDEVSAIAEAARIACAAVEAGQAAARPGATEAAVRGACETALARAGSRSPFAILVASGPRSADPHAGTSDRQLRAGEPCWIDLGAEVRGYIADITRTIVVGDGTMAEPDLMAAQEAAKEAQSAAIAAVRPGVTAASVDAAARAAIRERGFASGILHRTGHGLGLQTHESPYIVDGNEEPLQEGMVFTVEPGVYLAGRGGVRIEDDVLVTESGCRVLTRA